MVLKANPEDVVAPLSQSPQVGADEVVAVGSNLAAGVSLRSVTKKYGEVTAIENITLDIPAGAYCCLLGPSGCGKTTALRMIAGHEAVTSGEVQIGDRTVTHLPPAKRNTAMMFQNYALFPHKTIWQNVEFGLKMKGISKPERRQRVDEILELVGLSHTANRKPDQLSGGQQQRIALARALVNRPQVLMLDEPLSALDENLRVRMRGELRKIQKQFGLTFIQVTHHVEEAFSLSDQIVVMNHGHIEQVATPTELFTTPASQFVAKFIGDNNIFAGKVVRSLPSVSPTDSNDIIELDVEGIGSVFAKGVSTPNGSDSACSVRPDLIGLTSAEKAPSDEALYAGKTAYEESPSKAALLSSANGHSQPNDHSQQNNQIVARIVDTELTGYVTRVILTIPATGGSLLYKVRTTDWAKMGLSVGQSVYVRWSVEDCVFLPY